MIVIVRRIVINQNNCSCKKVMGNLCICFKVTIQRNLLNYRSTTRFQIPVWERNGTGKYIRGFWFAT